MRLTFLGTRGGIAIVSRRHRRHSALLVENAHGRILIDCGGDWLGRLAAIAPLAILVTHAHPDHAGALAGGTHAPVFASAATARTLAARYPAIEIRALVPHRSTMLAGIAIEPVPVVHSLLAPAVGYRIDGRVFYAPDITDLRSKPTALRSTELYIGDGARLVRPLIRTDARGRRFGHTSIRRQLDWCGRGRVPRAIFTHCGSEVVRDHAAAAKIVRELGRQRAVDARIAEDGLVVQL